MTNVEESSAQSASLGSLLRLLFGVEAAVNRRTYAVAGFSLMAFKYLVDSTVIRLVSGKPWWPLDYLSPLASTRAEHFGAEHDLLQLGLVLWTMPFLWIGLSMTIRRAADAAAPPLFSALLFFVPFFNYAWMLVLCALPSDPSAAPRPRLIAPRPESLDTRLMLKAVLASLVVAGAAFATNVYVFRSYGSVMFIGAPILLGATGAVVYNAKALRSWKESMLVATASTACVGGALMLFGAEGFLCIAMALPLALPVSLFGAVIGYTLAAQGRPSRSTAALVPIVWCALSWYEARETPLALGRATTTVAIAAPRETVWRHVVSFSELPAPDEFYFRLGIAYPMRARIDGSGVGAVRHCEFSTGPFVEPITVWDEPSHLGFDVIAAPPPLVELSPYDELAPPHLESYFASRRGEFRLHTDAQGTRLEGTTWYELRLGPAPYWRLWSNALVHRIHSRVLDHVRTLAESDTSSAAGR